MNRTAMSLAVTNLAAYLAMVVVNALANALPLNGRGTGEISDSYPNLFVPAGLTFSIWGLIYLLLLSFSVYGLVVSSRGSEGAEEVERIGPFFALSSLANLGWIFAWHWEVLWLSLILMVVILVTLILAYLRLDVGRRHVGAPARLFVHLPLSVYLGWITVATIANATALLVAIEWDGFGIAAPTWTVVMLAAATAITLTVIATRRDLAYSLVVIWAFLGIALERSAEGDAPVVTWTALTAAGLILVAALGGRLLLQPRRR